SSATTVCGHSKSLLRSAPHRGIRWHEWPCLDTGRGSCFLCGCALILTPAPSYAAGDDRVLRHCIHCSRAVAPDVLFAVRLRAEFTPAGVAMVAWLLVLPEQSSWWCWDTPFGHPVGHLQFMLRGLPRTAVATNHLGGLPRFALC